MACLLIILVIVVMVILLAVRPVTARQTARSLLFGADETDTFVDRFPVVCYAIMFVYLAAQKHGDRTGYSAWSSYRLASSESQVLCYRSKEVA